MSNRFKVISHLGSYDVMVCDDLVSAFRQSLNGPVHILVDRYIWKKYVILFRGITNVKTIKIIDAVEKNKSLDRVVLYVKFLLKKGIQKNHTILVIGGGQVQDVGSFAAHMLLRGVPWVFVPTTLLAMADSCIGSKSAINVGKYKNQVGAFFPPSHVLIYPPFCKTLPDDGIRDGKGEILKHAFISGGKPFVRITKILSNIPVNIAVTTRMIVESLNIKKTIIEKDEFDMNLRKILNYGHTFGHALEGYTRNAITHGVGVLIGMDMANYISTKRGLLSRKEFDSISDILHENISHDVLPIRNVTRYMDYLSHDKKVAGKSISVILSRGIGKIEMKTIALDKRLANEIKEYSKYFRMKRKIKKVDCRVHDFVGTRNDKRKDKV